jgi:hypothetical protein
MLQTHLSLFFARRIRQFNFVFCLGMAASRRRSSSKSKPKRVNIKRSAPASSSSLTAAQSVTNVLVKPLQVGGGIFNEVLGVLLQIIGGFTQGVDTIGEEGERFIDAFINANVNVRLLQVFKSIGNTCKYVADEIGKIIAVIPLVGNTAAYIVRGTGDNVYHIVMATNRLLTSTAGKLGRFASKSLDLCVFTITAVSDEVKLIGDDIINIVDNLTLRKNNHGSIPNVVGPADHHTMGGRSRRNRGGRRTSRSRRARGGGRVLCYSRYL